jgi:hypothetical protein
MNPDLRLALLAVAVVFCLAFGAMTLAVIADSGLDILTITSLGILVIILFGLVGAFRSPPE